MTVKPLAYGYMRVEPGEPDQVTMDSEHKLWTYAESEGFTLAGVYCEYDPGLFIALHELTHELQRADAHTVIVPSMRHLGANEALRRILIEGLQLNANAHVMAARWPEASFQPTDSPLSLLPTQRCAAWPGRRSR